MGIQINGQTDTVTATDGSINVGGDVTIPGVLTYEDVTNVDSVGIVTARDGIIVTGGSVGIGTTDAGSNALSVHGRTILGKVATDDAISKAEMVSKAALRIRPHVTNSGALNFAQVNNGSSIGVQFTNGSGTADWDIALQPYGGSVGIGTDAPGQKLDIDGNIRLRAGNTTTYATTLKSNLNATHTSSLTSNVNNVTEFELIGSYADSGGSNPRVVLAAGGQKVGIGTDNPYARNHIEINVNAGAGSGSAAALWLKNANQTANNSATIFFGNNVSQAAGAINFIHKDYSTNAGDITFDTRTNGSTYAERLRITSDGILRQSGSSNALGQGTSVAKLTHRTIDGTTPGGVGDVTTLETISATSNGSDYRFRITKREGSGGGSCYLDLGGNSDGSITFGTNTSGSGTERLRIASDGNVGINCNDPDSMLELNAAADTKMGISLGAVGDNITASRYIGICKSADQTDLGANSGFQGIEFGGPSSTNEGYLAFHTHDLGVESGERIRLTKDGKFGVGLTAPVTKVQIRDTTTYGKDTYASANTGGSQTPPPGTFKWDNVTPVAGHGRGYKAYVQSGDAYPNASNYIDVLIRNASFYRITLKRSHSSAEASVCQMLIYGLANSGNSNYPVVHMNGATGSGTSTATIQSGNGRGSSNAVGSFYWEIHSYNVNTHDSIIRITTTGNNNQGIVALIEEI